jgi:HK97 family phage prohead protease
MQEMIESAIIQGYASVFHTPDQQGDILMPGAFKKDLYTLLNIPVLWQHYPNTPIGKVTSAKEDQYGLWVTLNICTETQIGKEAIKLIESGILRGLSIGFKAICTQRGTGNIRRKLYEVKLKEISLVTFPSHEKAIIIDCKKNLASL